MTMASTASPRKRSMRRSRPSSAAYAQALTAERRRSQADRKLERPMVRGAEYPVSRGAAQRLFGAKRRDAQRLIQSLLLFSEQSFRLGASPRPVPEHAHRKRIPLLVS